MCTHMPDETAQAQHFSNLDEQQDHAFIVRWSIPGLADAQGMCQVKVGSFGASEMFVFLEEALDFVVAVPVEQVARIPTMAWDAKQIFGGQEDAMVDPLTFFFGPIDARTFRNTTVVHFQPFALPFHNLWRLKCQG